MNEQTTQQQACPGPHSWPVSPHPALGTSLVLWPEEPFTPHILGSGEASGDGFS